MNRIHGLALAGALLVCAVPVPAQVGGTVRLSGPSVSAELAFGPREVTIIREYYGTAPSSDATGRERKAKKPKKGKKDRGDGDLPPGLQRKLDREGRLPPGLQKRLDRGDPLPPGLAKRRLPADLERRLTPLPAGYERYVVGPDVVIVDSRRNVVVDVAIDIVIR